MTWNWAAGFKSSEGDHLLLSYIDFPKWAGLGFLQVCQWSHEAPQDVVVVGCCPSMCLPGLYLLHHGGGSPVLLASEVYADDRQVDWFAIVLM